MSDFISKNIKRNALFGETSFNVRLYLGIYGWTVLQSDMGITCPQMRYFSTKEEAITFYEGL